MHDDIRHETSKILPNQTQIESTPKFKTPEEIAAHDSVDVNLNNETEHNQITVEHHLSAKLKNKKKYWPPTKKQLIIGFSVLFVLILGGGLLSYFASLNKPTVAVVATIKPKPKPKKVVPSTNTVPSTLTGLPVAPSVNARPITAVMIENTPQARPQAGLSQAGVVFEALTEGGISRFMALFQNQLPSYIGPIRSVRPYYLEWDLGFDAPLAHVGGSPLALSEIQPWGVKNLDYLLYPSYYKRISSRPPPHNVYTSLQNLMNLEATKGWTSSSFKGWPRKADTPSKNPNATNINFQLSYSTYNVNYQYDSSNDSYLRSEGGAPQIDANTNTQLDPKVVIGMIVPWSRGPLDTSGAYYSVYQVIGSGQAYIFQDGTLTIGQWNKASAQAPLTFTQANGQPLALNAGQTWITALASSNEVTYN